MVEIDQILIASGKIYTHLSALIQFSILHDFFLTSYAKPIAKDLGRDTQIIKSWVKSWKFTVPVSHVTLCLKEI